jgi:hypothetical protein
MTCDPQRVRAPATENQGLLPASDKRGGYPGSGHGPTMPPPPPDPSGSPPSGDVSDAFTWPPAERYPATEWFKAQLREAQAQGRQLDPVRAHALHEAVRWAVRAGVWEAERILEVADLFALWLDPPEAS